MNKLIITGFLILLVSGGCAGVDNPDPGEVSVVEEKAHQNRLADEQSPYLLQHADNPVNWYPWGEEAFAKAREEDKPIFLSIGYSTCHWCHVMEHESFENPEIGALMNEVFVSIKVDREERPDIDGVYMTVSQMMTGGGGWPLTVIMTPDKKPFYTAAYIPRETRGQAMGMRDFIPLIGDAWINRRDELINSAETISREIRKRTGNVSGGLPSIEIVKKGYGELEKRFDADYGGFSVSPKFPSAHNLLFLLRVWKASENEKALFMVTDTLKAMRKGGIYDHLGGGFHRYATDRAWNVPHFEKMLYDQAMISMAYTEAYLVTGEPLFEETIRGILDYILRDMTSPEGGFYSAEDADSEGEEGKFYTWSWDELSSSMTPLEFSLFTEVFAITEPGNYRDEATGSLTGMNILFSDDENLLEKKNLETVKRSLFQLREKRVHPFKDDKILTDWNGLMIAAMAKAGRILNEEKYITAAERAGKFIVNEMEVGDGSLLHRYRQGEKGIEGYLEDYVFAAWGFHSLYEATLNTFYLQKAIDLVDYAVVHFWDEENFGFYSVSDTGDALLFREKESYDGAVPSGNSAAMELLLKLGRITGRSDLIETAENTARAFSDKIESLPAAYTHFISGLSMFHGVPREVIITGEAGDPIVNKMLDVLKVGYYPNTIFLFVPSGSEGDSVKKLIPYLGNYQAVNGKATVYVCSNYSCELPTGDPDIMKKLMR